MTYLYKPLLRLPLAAIYWALLELKSEVGTWALTRVLNGVRNVGFQKDKVACSCRMQLAVYTFLS
jgi:hypothetical protein